MMWSIYGASVWSADPLAGVVTWGTAGVCAWFLVAALVGSLLGILREYDRPKRRVPQSPDPTPRPRRLRLAYN